MAGTVMARLACDEPTARRIAALVAESLDDAVCSAFEADGGYVAELHFRQPPDRAALAALVSAAAGEAAAAALTFTRIAERDWVALSLTGLTPVTAGRFTIHGAHDRARIKANVIGIEIEAGLAFGTGHHGSTRGCLLALDWILKSHRPFRILDIGTGTGVLAIAAAKALRAPVLASDIDPRAVAVARANVRHNRAITITVVQAATLDARHYRERAPFDLVLANILIGPLQRMATPMARLAAPRVRVVLSGLLTSHANAALAAYRAQGFALERRMVLEDWATLVLRRGR